MLLVYVSIAQGKGRTQKKEDSNKNRREFIFLSFELSFCKPGNHLKGTKKIFCLVKVDAKLNFFFI